MAQTLPPLNALRSFIVAARWLSISRAADELCVTHGAVSRQVRQLEDWLGCAVFLRTATGLTLTPAGERLYRCAQPSFNQISKVCDELRSQRLALTLACPGSFLMRWLIPRLDRFKQAYPQLDLHLSAADQLPDFSHSAVDAAIIATQAPWPSACQVTLLGGQSFGPVCSPQRAAAVTQALDLSAQPLLHTASYPLAWSDWAEHYQLNKQPFTQGQRFEHLYYMLEAAVAGLGWALAPELLVRSDLAAGRLCAPLGFVEGKQSFVLLIPLARAQEPALHSLRVWLQQEVLHPELA